MLTLSSWQYRIASRLRLGLKVTTANQCRDCKEDMSDYLHHSLGCSSTKRTTLNHRHNMLRDALLTWCRRLALHTTKEPTNLSDAKGDHPDLMVMVNRPTGDKAIYVDVTIRHPCVPSCVSQGARTALYAARKGEQQKIAKYKTMCADVDADFVPLAVESFGAFGERAVKLCKEIAHQAKSDTDPQCTWTQREATIGIFSSLSIALQRGNAAVVKAAGPLFEPPSQVDA
jgi:hypothetical protein